MSSTHTARRQREPFAVEMTEFLDELLMRSAVEAGQARILSASAVQARRQPCMLEHHGPNNRLGLLCAKVSDERRASTLFQLALDLADSGNLVGDVNVREQISKKPLERVEIELGQVASENHAERNSTLHSRGKLRANRSHFAEHTRRCAT